MLEAVHLVGILHDLAQRHVEEISLNVHRMGNVFMLKLWRRSVVIISFHASRNQEAWI